MNESTRVSIEEYKSIMKKYEEQLQEKDKQVFNDMNDYIWVDTRIKETRRNCEYE